VLIIKLLETRRKLKKNYKLRSIVEPAENIKDTKKPNKKRDSITELLFLF